MPVPAMSRPVVTVSQLPERALTMPENRQSDATAPQRGVVELRRLAARP